MSGKAGKVKVYIPRYVPSAEEILERYGRLLHQLGHGCLRRLPKSTMYNEEDLFNEAVAETLRALPKYDPARSAFITFLQSAVTHRFIKIIDREWRQRGKFGDTSVDHGVQGEWHSNNDLPKLALSEGPSQGAIDVLLTVDPGSVRAAMVYTKHERRRAMVRVPGRPRGFVSKLREVHIPEEIAEVLCLA